MNGSKLPISAYIICQDEEAYLANCLRSLAQCAEIVVVDSGSKDGTAGLVRQFQEEGWPIRFLHQKWLGYAAQKQFAMEQCQQAWVLNIDADERLDADFCASLPELIQAPETIVGWRIRRRQYLIGYGYPPKSVYERANLRLVRQRKGRYDLTQRVHEGICVSSGEVKEAQRGSLLHYRPIPVDEHILKMNKYSTLKADQLFAEGKSPRLMRLVFNPLLYFLRTYFKDGLFRCGFPGFIQAMTNAVYSFLTESKIYQRHAQKEKPPADEGG